MTSFEIEHFSNNDLIEIDDQNTLIQIGEMDSEHSFMVGDIVNRNWESAIANGWDKPQAGKWIDYVTRKRVCAAAASYYKKSGRTVRYYADVALAFPRAIREQFEVLSFNHFAKARKYDDWRAYLEYARDGDKETPGPVSVDKCEAKWDKKHKQAIANLITDESEVEEENERENRFSLSNVCRYAVDLLKRFDDPRILKAIELINEVVAESVKPDKMET